MYKSFLYSRLFSISKMKSLISYSKAQYQKYLPNAQWQRSVEFFLCVVCLLIFSMSDTFAIQTDALKDPMKTLKKEAFDWAFALKIAAGLLGSVTALMKQSLTPFGIGLGAMAGLSFFDVYIGTGDAALISELLI